MNENEVLKKGLKRDIIDKFYTKPEVVKYCIKFCKIKLNIADDDLIIEPSAGNGAFINEIKNISSNWQFYDLKPENDEIIRKDFLELNTDNIFDKNSKNNKNSKNSKNNKIHIIGNPPFGRQSSLAIKFIKKSCGFADSISFILPKSFKKNSMKKYFDKYFHLIYEIDLNKNSFLLEKKEYDVPCIFQIWQKRNYKREEVEILKSINFQFVKKDENPDISFRRVGVYAGNISTEYNDKSIQSHYFIKFNLKGKDGKDINELINNLKNIKFELNNTVGPKSISKQELIKEFNKYLE